MKDLKEKLFDIFEDELSDDENYDLVNIICVFLVANDLNREYFLNCCKDIADEIHQSNEREKEMFRITLGIDKRGIN